MSEIDDLVHRADLDGLVRLIDRFCASADWAELSELRSRTRAAVNTGRQLWPAATLAEYRLALWAPAEWAALMLDEDGGRFTIGPLTEVVAQGAGAHDVQLQNREGRVNLAQAHRIVIHEQYVGIPVGNEPEIFIPPPFKG